MCAHACARVHACIEFPGCPTSALPSVKLQRTRSCLANRPNSGTQPTERASKRTQARFFVSSPVGDKLGRHATFQYIVTAADPSPFPIRMLASALIHRSHTSEARAAPERGTNSVCTAAWKGRVRKAAGLASFVVGTSHCALRHQTAVGTWQRGVTGYPSAARRRKSLPWPPYTPAHSRCFILATANRFCARLMSCGSQHRCRHPIPRCFVDESAAAGK